MKSLYCLLVQLEGVGTNRLHAWTDRGSAVVELVRPNVARVTSVGHVSKDLIPDCLAHLERTFESGLSIAIVNDARDLVSYQTGVRMWMTRWTINHRRRIHGIVFYTTSPTVKMGVTVANLALAPSNFQLSIVEHEHELNTAYREILRWADTQLSGMC